jgi:hypothetical protein
MAELGQQDGLLQIARYRQVCQRVVSSIVNPSTKQALVPPPSKLVHHFGPLLPWRTSRGCSTAGCSTNFTRSHFNGAITLRNSDYKILARVFARRFGMAMQSCIGPEQTAYLPGREIGDGIFPSQLVATNLALMQQPGAVVLLDIAKAFDTIDNSFLVAIIRRCGGSLGM